ncbi:MAG: DUF4923 family protein [Prevotella sp.]|nr:DUF4923 family protein [Prevotella sp.]
MKKNIITAVALACLLAAPVAQAAAANAGVEMTEMATPKKKTTKKKTTKKTTTKKSTTKKSTATTTAKVDSSKTAEAATSTSSSSTGLGSVLGGILGAATGSSSSTAGSILSGLTSIFDANKQATASDLAGTWNYTEPAVVFSSENALKNIGGKLASSAIESKLKTQFAKLGIKKGAMKMTFDKDGNFTQTIAGKTLSGTYTIKKKQVVLSYAGQVQQFIGTTQVDGNDLLIVMDASKLLKYASVIGTVTGSSALKTLGSLLGSMDGMQVGLKLNK